jgi:hypothetical protein
MAKGGYSNRVATLNPSCYKSTGGGGGECPTPCTSFKDWLSAPRIKLRPQTASICFSTDLTAARFFGNLPEDFARGRNPRAGTGPLHLVAGPVSFTRAEFRILFAQSQYPQYHERPFCSAICTLFSTGFPQGGTGQKSFLGSEPLKREDWGGNHVSECVEKQVWIFTAVKPERHFIEIGRKVLGTNLVPRSHDSALQQREGALNRIGVNISNRIDMFAVIDSLMAVAEFSKRSRVGREIISHNHVYIFGDVFADVLCERALSRIGSVEKSKIAIALADTNDNLFVSSTLSAPILADTAQFAAYIGFIHLNRSVEHRLTCLFHCCADAMAEVPRRLVAPESERALNLASTHALLGLAEQQGSQEPLCKGQMRVIEDRPSHHCELVVAILAVVESLFGFKLNHGQLATQAADAFGPAQASQNLPALLIGREHGVYVN